MDYLSMIQNRHMQQKRLRQFCYFVHKCLLAEQYLENGNILDSYTQLSAGLTHWAQMSLLENNVRNQELIWNTIQKINPSLYKLQEQLIASPETLEQRIQLVLIAYEFSVSDLIKTNCDILFGLFKKYKRPLDLREIQVLADLMDVYEELELLLRKLIKRGYLSEIILLSDIDQVGKVERRYALRAENFSSK